MTDLDTQTLVSVYRKLLDARNTMLAGIDQQEQSASRRAVMVDSLILGLLHHLHAVANDPDIHAPRMIEFGGPFMIYAELAADQLITVISQSDGFQSPPVDPGSSADATRRRPSRS
ncbi:MAG: hypothetical protein WA208_02140 [Thermoanaerobaculia bacterium]